MVISLITILVVLALSLLIAIFIHGRSAGPTSNDLTAPKPQRPKCKSSGDCDPPQVCYEGVCASCKGWPGDGWDDTVCSHQGPGQLCQVAPGGHNYCAPACAANSDCRPGGVCIDGRCQLCPGNNDFCDAGMVCDPATSLCVPPCSEVPCKNGWVCDIGGTVCLPCNMDSDCLQGDVCDGGSCKPGCPTTGCTGGAYCNGARCTTDCRGIAGACEAGICDPHLGVCGQPCDPATCAAQGLGCDPQYTYCGRCEMWGGAPCAPGYTCRNTECVPVCTETSCGTARSCLASGICGPCFLDEDCPAGKTCHALQCT